jgi:hypothetical protein
MSEPGDTCKLIFATTGRTFVCFDEWCPEHYNHPERTLHFELPMSRDTHTATVGLLMCWKLVYLKGSDPWTPELERTFQEAKIKLNKLVF